MKTARQRVLDYVQAHRAVTTAELCQALNSTEANIRHHLNILQQQGVVRVIEGTSAQTGSSAGGAKRRGAGRPPRLFGPVDPSPAEHLAALAAALIEEILPALSADQCDSILHSVADRLATELSEPAPNPAAPGDARRTRADTLTARLFNTVERLNQARYQARWEARPDGPRIIIGHCPFGSLPHRQPRVCQVDAYLIETLLGAPVEQLKRLEKDSRGLPYCLFRLSKPAL